MSSRVVFAGIADRASYGEVPKIRVPVVNVIGLRPHISALVYPAGLKRLFFIFAVNVSKEPLPSIKVDVIAPDATRVASVDAELCRPDGAPLTHVDIGVPDSTWVVFASPIDSDSFVLPVPGEYKLIARESGEQIGAFSAHVIEPEPLTPDRVAAILADPSAISVVHFTSACTSCGDALTAYAALRRDPAEEAHGSRWFEDLPREFVCKCGSHRVNLELVRQNLIGYLGRRDIAPQAKSVVRMYERSILVGVRAAFVELLKSDVDSALDEETFQKFLWEHPIMFHQWPARRIFSKPPILSLRAADFAVVTPDRELVLIEIERASTPLLKKDGGVHHKLQHAFDQVNEWLHVADDQRLAVLDCIGIAREEVAKVRGVVIAGRTAGYPIDQLRRLKSVDFGRVQVFTYDDLLGALDSLIERFDSL